MRAPLSRGPVSLDVEHLDRPDWSLPLGDLERPSTTEHTVGAPK